MAIPRTPLAIRFWAKVRKTRTCWLWTGAINQAGYGMINLGGRGRAERAHRVSYLLHCGPIPKDLCVCHDCDVPACVRPDHLFLGTRDDNNKDCARKDRYDKIKRPKGMQHGMSHLTDRDVKRIRSIHAKPNPPTYKITADNYGVSLQQIFRIVRRESWKHI